MLCLTDAELVIFVKSPETGDLTKDIGKSENTNSLVSLLTPDPATVDKPINAPVYCIYNYSVNLSACVLNVASITELALTSSLLIKSDGIAAISGMILPIFAGSPYVPSVPSSNN